jgi:hypothetical protein
MALLRLSLGFTLVLCLSLAIAGTRAESSPGLAVIWAVDDGEKVFQDDLDHPLKWGGAGNSVWDGSKVRLFAAANEIVAFQLILEADVAGASSVNVTVSDLTNGATVIRGSHPLLPPNDYATAVAWDGAATPSPASPV